MYLEAAAARVKHHKGRQHTVLSPQLARYINTTAWGTHSPVAALRHLAVVLLARLLPEGSVARLVLEVILPVGVVRPLVLHDGRPAVAAAAAAALPVATIGGSHGQHAGHLRGSGKGAQ